MSLKRLKPDTAAALFISAPEKVLFTFQEIVDKFGITVGELLAELRSGELVAHGNSTEDAVIRADELSKWLIKDRPIAHKARVALKNLRRLH